MFFEKRKEKHVIAEKDLKKNWGDLKKRGEVETPPFFLHWRGREEGREKIIIYFFVSYRMFLFFVFFKFLAVLQNKNIKEGVLLFIYNFFLNI